MSPSASSAKRSSCSVSRDGEEFVDRQLKAVGERRQVGVAVVGRRGDLLDHAGQRIGRDFRQRHADAEAREGAVAAGLRHAARRVISA